MAQTGNNVRAAGLLLLCCCALVPTAVAADSSSNRAAKSKEESAAAIDSLKDYLAGDYESRGATFRTDFRTNAAHSC